MNYHKLLISLIAPQLAGLIGSLFTAPAVGGWYAALDKPAITPPGWLFGPVWITLYILMGISVYLVWSKRRQEKKVKPAVNLFWIHLLFNAGWSIIFFGLRMPGLAFVNIIIIWLFILVLIWMFEKISRVAGWLLVPYLFWVSFATVLNLYIFLLN